MKKKLKENKKSVLPTVFTIILLLVSVVIMVLIEKIRYPSFDKNLAGKEGIVMTDVAEIHYDDPVGRSTVTVQKSQKFELTGAMHHILQSDIVMVEITLDGDRHAWINQKDIIISK